MSGEAKYVCIMDGESFSTLEELCKHVREIHGENPAIYRRLSELYGCSGNLEIAAEEAARDEIYIPDYVLSQIALTTLISGVSVWAVVVREGLPLYVPLSLDDYIGPGVYEKMGGFGQIVIVYTSDARLPDILVSIVRIEVNDILRDRPPRTYVLVKVDSDGKVCSIRSMTIRDGVERMVSGSGVGGVDER